MKAYVHVFSGTGNTARAANLLGEGLKQAGYEVQFLRVEHGAVPPEGEYDLHIFAAPVYAFAPPHIMMRYIRKVRPGNGAAAVVITTHGEVNEKKSVPGWPGQALAQMKRMLKRRGYDVFLTESIGFPENVTQGFSAPEPKEQAGIFRIAEEQLALITKKVLNRETSFKRLHFLNQIWCWLFGLIFNHIGRRFLGKLYVADNQCTACGKCVRSCPVSAIKLVNGRARWKLNCEGCQRCMNLCPFAAIQVSYLRLIVLIAAMFPPYAAWLRAVPGFGFLPAAGPISWIDSIIFSLAGSVLAVYLLDKVIFGLEQIPGVRKFCELNYTRKYRRYLEPHFHPVEVKPENKKVRYTEKTTL